MIENENPNEETFHIGPIISVKKKSVYIQYFNA